MTLPDVQLISQILTERLLNSAAAGVLLVGLVWMLLRLIGRQNSGTRFAVWFSALLATAAFPFVLGSTFLRLTSHIPVESIPHRSIVLSSYWATYLFVAWAGGAMLALLRLAIGVWRVLAVRRNCLEVDLANVEPAIAELVRQFASRRRVTLCTSTELRAPAAIGLFRPAIVFPEWLLPQLSTGELEVIVRHELAHLSRWDDWTNLVQKIVKSLFFFHPAVWWIENRLTLEREMACDAIVLEQTGRPRSYASSLISFAEKLQNARGLALVQTLVSRMQQMSKRVAEILDAKRPRGVRLWKPGLGLSGGLLAVVFVAAPYMPRLVAFESRPSDAEFHPPLMKAPANSLAANEGINRALTVPVTLRSATPMHSTAASFKFHPRTKESKTHVAPKVPLAPLLLRTCYPGNDLHPAHVAE